MYENGIAFWLALVGTAFWGIRFWWMHRISTKQNNFLDQLREQGKRLEKLSRIEHDFIKEVHPQVGEIKEGMAEVMTIVREKSEKNL
jgi:hypothetical protein